MKNEAMAAISINKFAVIFLSLTSSIASFTTPELERKIEITASIWSITINSNAISIKIESAKINPAGIKKYQKCSSKKDSSSNSSHSSLQIVDEHSIVVIDNHLIERYIYLH
ncbi:MAG: hypothetical protein ACFE8B_07655 [Candidatus Hermodarchaeota archaeon]